jgi:hypothetical protein
MTMSIRTAALGLMALAGLGLGVTTAHAGGCCGGGATYRGGYGGGHTFARTASYGGSCCSGMSMAGMSMPAMATPAMQAPGMQAMNMGGYPYPQAPVAATPAASPAANGARYTCSMHPNVVSSTPASCPLCGMALTRK